MGRKIDLTGKVFGYWTVIEEDKALTRLKRTTYWKCKCKCGTEKSVAGASLRNNLSKSCGCYNEEVLRSRSTVKIGKKYGRLLVVKSAKDEENKNNSSWNPSKFLCQCDCGNTTIVYGPALISGNTKSCGCYKKERQQDNKKDLLNLKIGKLTVIESTNRKNKYGCYYWKCKCDCGNFCEKDSATLLAGKVNSCGCITSRGENKIESLLLQNNISFIKQKTFENCKNLETNYLFRFDFYVENSFLIEFDGIQHFSAIGGWSTEDYLELTKQRDEYKNNWCKENNIPLKRIPYWKLDTLTLEDLMGDEYLI